MRVIWDFNGTIIDDLDLCLDLLNLMLIKRGLGPIDKKRYLDIFTFPIKDYYDLAGFTYEGYTFTELGQEFIRLYQKKSLECPLHKGVIKALSDFKAMGFKQYLLSASQIDNLMEQVKHFGIEKYFDGILGLSNIYAKGKTEIALEYFKDAKISPANTIMIGDTLHDAQVASELNCDIIIYSKGHQAKSRFKDLKVIDDYHELMGEIKLWQQKNNTKH